MVMVGMILEMTMSSCGDSDDMGDVDVIGVMDDIDDCMLNVMLVVYTEDVLL